MANPNPFSALFTTDVGGTSVIANKNSFALVQRGNQLISLGGFNQGTAQNTSAIELTTFVDGGLSTSGGLSGWTKIGDLPALTSLHAATMLGDWIYVVGGATGAGIGTVSSQVVTVRVESNGSVTEVYTELPFPVTVESHRVLAFNNRLYVLGGVQGGSYSNVCWFCDIGGNGRPVGNWQQTTPLPNFSALNAAVVTYNGVVVVSGGNDSVNALTNVWSSVIQSNGQLGAWSNQTPMNLGRYRHSMVQIGENLLVFGGYNTANQVLGSVEYAQVDAQGRIGQGGWALSTSVAATLFVPSTTSPDGITFTANIPGAGGDAITVTFNAPAGGSTTVSVVGTAITVSPATGAVNSDVVTAIQASIPANALVSVVATGPSDLVVAFSTTPLAGGNVAGASLLTPSGRHQPAVFDNGKLVYLVGGYNSGGTNIVVPQVYKRY